MGLNVLCVYRRSDFAHFLCHVFRDKLARPLVTGRLGTRPASPQVRLPAQVGGGRPGVDATIVHVLAAVGLSGHRSFRDVLHGNLLGPVRQRP
jgi:hypothetical protein